MNEQESWLTPREAERFIDSLDRGFREMAEQADRQRVIDAQVKAAEAQEAAARAQEEREHAQKAEVLARTRQAEEAARAKGQAGAAKRAENSDLLIIHALATLAGYVDDDPVDAAKALMEHAYRKGVPLAEDPRTVARRLELARAEAAKHKR